MRPKSPNDDRLRTNGSLCGLRGLSTTGEMRRYVRIASGTGGMSDLHGATGRTGRMSRMSGMSESGLVHEASLARAYAPNRTNRTKGAKFFAQSPNDPDMSGLSV
jgi:hypothetical protein